MTIAYERQELRALAAFQIRGLSAYCVDYIAACRAGAIIAAQSVGLFDPTHSWALERDLSATDLRATFPLPKVN